MCELSIKLNIDKDLKNKINTMVLTNKEQNLESYILKLIDRDINSKVYFEKGFYFDYYRDKLLHEDKEIELTKTEYKIFRILLNTKNSIVTYEQIFNEIENISKSTLSIFVAKIKIKTYERLIKTVRNRGYLMIIDNYLLVK
jgi:DNA-binding response OmpR family regulator